MRFTAAALCVFAGTAGWVGTTQAETSEMGGRIAVYTPPAPPAGFDPVAASDADLARYGMPPRPNPFARDGLAYATWSHAMKHAKIRVAPQVRVTRHRHVPAVALRRLPGEQAGTLGSTNWSGEIVLSGASSYGGSSYTEVLAQWLVSAVQQPVGSCSGFDVSSTWVGIDGANGSSSDVVQGGTEADTGCSNGVTTQNFYPWFEWYPDDEYEITNFIMYRGASVFVVVQATGPTTANVTYVNLETENYTIVSVKAPPGTSLKGSSAEWIVERPTINNTIGTLADFGFIQMSSEVAYVANQVNTGSYDVAGAPLGGRTGYMVDMVDSSNNPLATPHALGTTGQYVDVEGAAQ
jgi:hypothetical protein